MNNLGIDTLKEERQKCSEIYEILGHSIIFGVLKKFIFHEINEDISKSKELREDFLKSDENLQKIINFFKYKNNVIKFKTEITSYYLEHKKSIDSLIDDSQKNTLSALVHVLSTFKSSIDKKNTTSFHPENLSDEIKLKVYEIINSKKGVEIIGDIKGNIAGSIDEGYIDNFFLRPISKINGSLIYIDTRDSVYINGYDIVGLGVEKSEFGGVKKAKVRCRITHTTKNIFLTNTFDILKDSVGNEILDIGNQIELFNGEMCIYVFIKDSKTLEKRWTLRGIYGDLILDDKGNEIISLGKRHNIFGDFLREAEIKNKNTTKNKWLYITINLKSGKFGDLLENKEEMDALIGGY